MDDEFYLEEDGTLYIEPSEGYNTPLREMILPEQEYHSSNYEQQYLILEQYAGRSDKTGQFIYVGDVVKINNYMMMAVEFYDSTMSFNLPYTEMTTDNTVIVGNIHDEN